MTTWIPAKEAAAIVGISARRFLAEWVPEDGPSQVTYRNLNGRNGPGRRPQVDREDLEAVLAKRTTLRTH